ncbi:MAG: nitronate monooxygenase family protein [Clostridium sp.]
MNIKPLIIGDLVAKIPVVQGGMGIGVSLSGLAGAVAKAGGIGIISGAQPGYREDDFESDPLGANLRSLKKHIKIAKEKSNNGIIGVNLMVAMNNYAEHIKASIEAGADLIISGAGMPTALPDLVKDCSIKIAPIVSSLKACKVILKLWDRRYSRTADMVVIEGPKAGGHLGFHKETLEAEQEHFDSTIGDILNEVSIYEEKYNKSIPVIVAGGVFDGHDIAKYLSLGASGVQMATRFVATEECDASLEFKMEYVNCKKENISIVKSPVGMPGRALNNKFIQSLEVSRPKIRRCYNCLIPCNPKDTPYCISDALMNAANGDTDNGLVFCGENAYKVDKISTVPEIINSLISEIKES